jgi:hypothetical protein
MTPYKDKAKQNEYQKKLMRKRRLEAKQNDTTQNKHN